MLLYAMREQPGCTLLSVAPSCVAENTVELLVSALTSSSAIASSPGVDLSEQSTRSYQVRARTIPLPGLPQGLTELVYFDIYLSQLLCNELISLEIGLGYGMAKKVAETELPATSYAVLGLISFGEMSGYDLKRFADRNISYFFWSPASSQIYAELRRLTSLGYVREREVAQERRPDKRLYRITGDGEQALRRWLERTEVVPDVVKSTFLLKLFLGRLTPVDTLIAQLEQRRLQIEETLGQFEVIEQEIEDHEEGFFPYLTLKSGIAHFDAALRWVEDAIEELNRRSPAEPPAE